MGRFRGMSIAARLFVQTTTMLVVTAAVAFGLLALDARSDARDEAAESSQQLSRTLAAAPTTQTSLAEAYAAYDTDREGAVARASLELQPFALAVIDETALDFVTIMHPDGTRYTHPNPAQIGGTFLGNTGPALRGGTVIEVYEGTLGPSVRAVVPVEVDGEVVGLVAGGVTIATLSPAIVRRLVQVGTVLFVAVAVVTVVTALMSRRLRTFTAGHDPEALGRLFAIHEAALHSVDDGLVLVGGNRIQLMNDRARTLLGIDGAAPLELDGAGIPEEVRRALSESVDSVLVGRRSLVIDRTGATVLGEPATMLTIRDRTALRRMAGELDAVRTMTRALRSQTHEFSNRLHTIATLIELEQPERALELAASERDIGQRLTDRVVGAIEEPVVAALLLGKAAEAHERGVQLHVETHLEPDTQYIDSLDFVTILGNLVDNGIDAAAEPGDRADLARWVEAYLALDDDEALVMQVTDSGQGIPAEMRQQVFETGWSTKAGDERRGFGLSLVRQTVDELGGTIEISRASAGGAVLTVRIPRSEVTT